MEDMRHMLEVCDQFAVDFDIKFTSRKSFAMRIGHRYNVMCERFELNFFPSSENYLT
jgi:hypothetical protein